MSVMRPLPRALQTYHIAALMPTADKFGFPIIANEIYFKGSQSLHYIPRLKDVKYGQVSVGDELVYMVSEDDGADVARTYGIPNEFLKRKSSEKGGFNNAFAYFLSERDDELVALLDGIIENINQSHDKPISAF